MNRGNGTSNDRVFATKSSCIYFVRCGQRDRCTCFESFYLKTWYSICQIKKQKRMTWFLNAFSVITRGASVGLRVATTIIKPVLNAIIAVAPGIASAARTLSIIPVIGQAAVTVAQAAALVESAAKAGREIIRVAEDFEQRMRPTAPVSVPIFTKSEPTPEAPVAVSVITQPKRLPTPEEMFGIVAQPKQATPGPSVAPAPVTGGIVHNRTILPMPARRGGVKINREYERNLKEILDELDTGDSDELSNTFANLHIGVPKSVRSGNNLWGLGGEMKRKRLGLEMRPWGI